MTDQQKTLDFLSQVRYVTLAVVRPDGKPWAVPVHIAHHKGTAFYWDSSPDAVHSRAIAAAPGVMLSMFRHADGNVQEFGFYAEATAKIDQPLADGRMRYRADIIRAWINDERHEKRELDLDFM